MITMQNISQAMLAGLTVGMFFLIGMSVLDSFTSKTRRVIKSPLRVGLACVLFLGTAGLVLAKVVQ